MVLIDSKVEDMRARADAINQWLETRAADTNSHLHLDRDAAECAYWHLGYQQALNDMIRMLSNAARAADTAGIPN